MEWCCRAVWVLAAVASAMLPLRPAGAAVAPEEEARVGRRVAAQMEAHFGRLDDPERLRRVVAIGRRLEGAAGMKPGTVSFTLLDAPDFNAMALPGNLIYVMRGLVDQARSDDELAAAMGHELSHIILGHTRQLLEEKTGRRRVVFVVENPMPDGTTQRRVVISEGPPSAPGARERELDADEEALALLARAGYDPGAAVGMLEHLRRPNEAQPAAGSDAIRAEARDFLSTHPSAEERIRRVQEHVQTLRERSRVSGER